MSDSSETEAPPPNLEQKLLRVHSAGGRANRSLAKLLCCRNYTVLEEDSEGPKLVKVRPMAEDSYWRRLGGRGGSAAMFEQVLLDL